MSQENMEQLVRAALRAFRARDLEGWVDCFHPNAEFLLPRNVLEGGSYRGHEGVGRALVDAFETWEDIRIEIQEVHALDEGAVILGRTVNVGKGDAPTVEYQSAYLAKLREGKIAYWRPYQSHVEAIEALRLSEQDAHADS
jgi:ketosteroid isomerase-like protein